MRKFLSLVLALVMTMSLVTISAGAKDFTDNDAIQYDEAVAVISAIGVVDGYAGGNFGPTGLLTRQAAAKIICNLVLGPTTAKALHADTAPFPDVPASGEFAGYITYCAQKGIINGYPDGTFRPGGSLTGYAFLKMLLGALGYDGAIEGFTGDNWTVRVAKLAKGLGLDKGLAEELNGTKTVNREEAALYAFNTLQADLVEYDTKITATVGGEQVTIGNSNAHPQEWESQKTRVNNIREDNIVQFAEQYFNKLEKKKDTDDFERPAYTWLYDKEEIGTYVDWDLLVDEYTTAVTGRELYDLLGATTLRESENDFAYFVDGLRPSDYSSATYNFSIAGIKPSVKDDYRGDIARSNTDDFGISDNGVLTQVFLDKADNRDEKGMITIVSINTFLAQATGDYQESKEFAPMDVFYDLDAASNTIKSNWNVDVEDVANVVDVKDEDFYLVNISFKDAQGGIVVEIDAPEIMEETTITKFSKSSDNIVDKLTTGGTEYKHARQAFFSDDALDDYNMTLLPDHTYNVYLDKYGYVIGVELDDGSSNYVFIAGFDRPTSNLSISTANASAIFLDGTMDTIRVNVTDTNKNIDRIKAADTGKEYFIKWTNTAFPGDEGCYRLNRWFTYSKNQSGVYTLTPATRMTATKYIMSDADSDGKVVIKTANVSLKDNILTTTNYPYSGTAGTVGSWDNGNPVTSAPFNAVYNTNNNVRAYGNDDSVYITVDMDDVDTMAGEHAITDVNGLYTGVQDVELEIDVTDSHLEEAQIYTVYDRNGYIIGAVTNAEAKGGNATIAYVLSDVKSERYESATDTHYWEFEAFVNGSKQTLTVKDKFNNMKGLIDTEYLYRRGHSNNATFNAMTTDLNAYDSIVELRFDSDGNVTDIKPVYEKDIYNWYLGGSSVSDAGGIDNHKKMDLDDAKVYRIGVTNNIDGAPTWTETVDGTHYYDSTPDTLMLRGRTLYVTADRSDEGLALTSDAKALTVQLENGKWQHTEYSSVNAAISALADAQPSTDGFQYDGEVIASLNSAGAATWVVFVNHTPLVTGNHTTSTSSRVYNVACEYIDPSSGVNGDEYVAFKLYGTNANQRYTVTMQTSFGGVTTTRTKTVIGKAGSTSLYVGTTDGFYGKLDRGTYITITCEDGVGTYMVPTGSDPILTGTTLT